MSDSDVLSVLGSQKYWILPEEIIEVVPPEPTYSSGTQAKISDTVSFCIPSTQRVFDVKSELEIYVLNIPKDVRAIEETEGILKHLAEELEDHKIEPVDLVKRAWKTGEPNGVQPSA